MIYTKLQQKTKDRVTRTKLKTGGELGCQYGISRKVTYSHTISYIYNNFINIIFKISNYCKLVFSWCPSLSFFSFWIVCFQICRRKHLVFQTFSIIDDYIFLLLYIYIQFPNIYLGLEYVGPSKRMLTGLPIHIFFAFGLLYIAGMGYFLRNWFYVQLVVGVPFAVFLLYWWWVKTLLSLFYF